MRVLSLMQIFEPEPALKGLALAEGLRALGHQVEVVTGFPNYPGGRLYPGYVQKLFAREKVGGTDVTRVPQFLSHDASALRRISSYMSFAGSAMLYSVLRAQRPDVIYVSQPPVAIGMAAICIGLLRNVPFVYDIQDLWPDSVRATGMIRDERLLRLIGAACELVYRRASKIVVLSDGLKAKLVERGVPASKVEVIYNWSQEKELSELGTSDELPTAMRGKFNVVFAGNLGRAQGLSAVLEAARLVSDVNPKVQFVFIGDGVESDSLRDFTLRLGLQNVQFLPRVPLKKISSILRASDVLLVHLRDDPLFSMTIPSKVQAYLATGRPLLVAVRGDAAELVQRAGAGLSAEPENAEAIAAAVIRLAAMNSSDLDRMGASGEAFYWRELSLSAGVARTARVLRAAVSEHGRRRLEAHETGL